MMPTHEKTHPARAPRDRGRGRGRREDGEALERGPRDTRAQSAAHRARGEGAARGGEKVMARKKSIEDPRPSRHDDLVAELLRDIPGVVARSGSIFHTDGDCRLETEVEKPCGKGFIDLCVLGYVWRKGHAPADLRDPWNSGGSTTNLLRRGLIVEVKSELERWSAGDVIRQLKGYRTAFDSWCEAEGYRGKGMRECDIKQMWPVSHPPEPHSVVAIFSGRRLTESEIKLFEYEDVVVL